MDRTSRGTVWSSSPAAGRSEPLTIKYLGFTWATPSDDEINAINLHDKFEDIEENTEEISISNMLITGEWQQDREQYSTKKITLSIAVLVSSPQGRGLQSVHYTIICSIGRSSQVPIVREVEDEIEKESVRNICWAFRTLNDFYIGEGITRCVSLVGGEGEGADYNNITTEKAGLIDVRTRWNNIRLQMIFAVKSNIVDELWHLWRTPGHVMATFLKCKNHKIFY